MRALAFLLAIVGTPLLAQHDTKSMVDDVPDAQPNRTNVRITTEETTEKPGKSFTEQWEDEDLTRWDTPIGEFRIGGYATFMHKTITRYNGGQSENFFDAIRIVPQFEWRMMEWLEFVMEIEFEGGGADVGFLSGNEILIEYAELRVTPMDEFNVQAGLLMIPFGRYNMNHDDVFWDLADRPYAARRVLPSAFDQPGVGIYGSFNQVPYFTFNYELDVTQGFNDGFSNNGGARDARQSFRRDNNGNKAIWTKVGIVPHMDEFGIDIVTADFGISYTYQEVGPDNSQSMRGVSIDGHVGIDVIDRFWIDVEGEWNRIWINRESDVNTPNGLSGYFVDISFKFDPFPESWKGDVFGRRPYIGLIIRIEENDLNDDHVGTAARDDRIGLTVGLAFRPISKLVFRLEFKHQQSKRNDDGDETRFVGSVSFGF